MEALAGLSTLVCPPVSSPRRTNEHSSRSRTSQVRSSHPRDLADPKRNFGPPNPVFAIQLAEARYDWRKTAPEVTRVKLEGSNKGYEL